MYSKNHYKQPLCISGLGMSLSSSARPRVPQNSGSHARSCQTSDYSKSWSPCQTIRHRFCLLQCSSLTTQLTPNLRTCDEPSSLKLEQRAHPYFRFESTDSNFQTSRDPGLKTVPIGYSFSCQYCRNLE